MEDRAQTKRWVQQQHAQQQELEMERAMLEEKAHREAQAKKEAQETALAAELARQKTLKIRDEKMRQRVREESQEIRQLRSQLEAAYTNREREKQGKGELLFAKNSQNWKRISKNLNYLTKSR